MVLGMLQGKSESRGLWRRSRETQDSKCLGRCEALSCLGPRNAQPVGLVLTLLVPGEETGGGEDQGQDVA